MINFVIGGKGKLHFENVLRIFSIVSTVRKSGNKPNILIYFLSDIRKNAMKTKTIGYAYLKLKIFHIDKVYWIIEWKRAKFLIAYLNKTTIPANKMRLDHHTAVIFTLPLIHKTCFYYCDLLEVESVIKQRQTINNWIMLVRYILQKLRSLFTAINTPFDKKWDYWM